MKIKSIKSDTEFFGRVETLMKSGYEIIEAVVEYCEENDLDVESVVPLIKSSPKFKALMQVEAENLNLITKTSKLQLE
jgi:hypothetical protein